MFFNLFTQIQGIDLSFYRQFHSTHYYGSIYLLSPSYIIYPCLFHCQQFMMKQQATSFICIMQQVFQYKSNLHLNTRCHQFHSTHVLRVIFFFFLRFSYHFPGNSFGKLKHNKNKLH